MTKEQLLQLKIETPSEEIYRDIKSKWDKMAKPLDSMGSFESITAQIGAILHTASPDINKKAVVVMCADNGVVNEGISQSGQDVTLAVARAMGAGKSSVCKMAQNAGVDVIPVDIGINSSEIIHGVLNKKIAYGTKNFCKEPAMPEDEMLTAINTGIDMILHCKKQGYTLVATGEMGIGNTTTSSAVTAALTGEDAAKITGRGAGLDDSKLNKKIYIIKNSIEKYELKENEPLRILQTVGGLDIAGIIGLILGGAIHHIPIVLDGFISMAAAYAAYCIKPEIRDYIIPSHTSKEPAVEVLLKKLDILPVINAGLALGEGTGAVMMMALLDLAVALFNEHSSFSDIGVTQYKRL